MAFKAPTGTEHVGSGDEFVANDGGRWFVMQNHDYVDGDGNYGMTTEYVANADGYDTEAAALEALARLHAA
jgi:hypothetical protein